jgi:sulfonate transport system substrate-binding protein
MELKGISLFHKGSIAVALAAILAIPLAQADVLRIGVATAGGGDPVTFSGSTLGIVRNQQLLEKAFAGTGTEVQWFFFKGAGPAVNEALSNQQLDFAYQGDLPAVVGRSNGLDTKLLAALGVRANLYLAVPKGSDLKSIDDLKGKKVAIFRGTNGHLVMINLLAEHGLTERDIKVINLDTGSTQAALVSNGVDAAFGGRELFKLRDKGLIDIIYDNPAQDVRYTRQTALVVRGPYEKEHPDNVQKVVDTLVDAAKWTSDDSHRDAVFTEWAKSNDPVESLRADFTGVSIRDRASPLVDNFLLGRYQAVADQAKEQKLIRRPVSIDGWFETSYLQNSLTTTGLENYCPPYGPVGKPPAGNAVAAATSKQGS